MDIILKNKRNILSLTLILFVSLISTNNAFCADGSISMVNSILKVDTGNDEVITQVELKQRRNNIHIVRNGCFRTKCKYNFSRLKRGIYQVKAVTNTGRLIWGVVIKN